MIINRRDFLRTTGLGVAAMSMAGVICKNNLTSPVGAAGVGMCDWNLGGSADPELIPKAKEAHLEGIQVSVGTRPDNMPLREQAVRRKYIEMGKRYGITFHSVAAGSILNRIPLASEPQSAVYVIDAIEAAKAEGKPVLIKFTADWCMNCEVVDKVVYQRKDIAGLIEDKGVLVVKGDTTRDDQPATLALKNEYSEPGVPVTILLLPGRDGPVRIHEVFFAEKLKEVLEELPSRPQ